MFSFDVSISYMQDPLPAKRQCSSSIPVRSRRSDARRRCGEGVLLDWCLSFFLRSLVPPNAPWMLIIASLLTSICFAHSSIRARTNERETEYARTYTITSLSASVLAKKEPVRRHSQTVRLNCVPFRFGRSSKETCQWTTPLNFMMPKSTSKLYRIAPKIMSTSKVPRTFIPL